jgi:hypothetical protein
MPKGIFYKKMQKYISVIYNKAGFAQPVLKVITKFFGAYITANN